MFDGKLIDFKNLSKPLVKLIEAVEKAIGRVYTPVDTIIQAHANAAALLINAEAEIKKSEITERAVIRKAFVEMRRQNNIDSIVSNASKELPKSVSNTEVEEDWTSEFFTYCKDIGNADMQLLWGKMLAGEVAEPGSFSRRTLATVKILSKAEAQMFSQFCSFIFEIRPGEYGFVVPETDIFTYMRKKGISAAVENHLKNIGLLSASILHLAQLDSKKDTLIPVKYFDKSLQLVIKASDRNEKNGSIRYFPLTKEGNELVAISGAEADATFIKMWHKTNPSLGPVLHPYVISAGASGDKVKNSRKKKPKISPKSPLESGNIKVSKRSSKLQS